MMSGSIGIPSVHPENFSQLHERGLIPRGEIYSSSFLFFSFQKKKNCQSSMEWTFFLSNFEFTIPWYPLEVSLILKNN